MTTGRERKLVQSAEPFERHHLGLWVSRDGHTTRDEEHEFVTNPRCGVDNRFPAPEHPHMSMRCAARYTGCDDAGCTCACHDEEGAL